MQILKIKGLAGCPVAQACNPSYSGDRDQEGHGLSQPGQIVHETLSQKNPSRKRSGGMAQGVGPECKPQYLPHKKIKGLKQKQPTLFLFKFSIHKVKNPLLYTDVLLL
jgi:hypothetical protein